MPLSAAPFLLPARLLSSGSHVRVVAEALRNRCVPAKNLDRLLRGAGRGDGRLRLLRRGFLQGRLVRVLTLELAHIHETADAKALRRVAGDLARRRKQRAPAGRLFHGVRRRGRTRWCRSAAAISRRKGSTLLQLCQNYMYLCVRIGKIDRLRRPLNAWIDTNSDR